MSAWLILIKWLKQCQVGSGERTLHCKKVVQFWVDIWSDVGSKINFLFLVKSSQDLVNFGPNHMKTYQDEGNFHQCWEYDTLTNR